MLASDIHQPQMFQGPTAQESRVSHPAAIAQGKLLLIGLMADAQLHADHIAMIDTTGTTNRTISSSTASTSAVTRASRSPRREPNSVVRASRW